MAVSLDTPKFSLKRPQAFQPKSHIFIEAPMLFIRNPTFSFETPHFYDLFSLETQSFSLETPNFYWRNQTFILNPQFFWRPQKKLVLSDKEGVSNQKLVVSEKNFGVSDIFFKLFPLNIKK